MVRAIQGCCDPASRGVLRPRPADPLKRDAIGLISPIVESCFRILELERVAGGKPVSTFPQPALERAREKQMPVFRPLPAPNSSF